MFEKRKMKNDAAETMADDADDEDDVCDVTDDVDDVCDVTDDVDDVCDVIDDEDGDDQRKLMLDDCEDEDREKMMWSRPRRQIGNMINDVWEECDEDEDEDEGSDDVIDDVIDEEDGVVMNEGTMKMRRAATLSRLIDWSIESKSVSKHFWLWIIRWGHY